MNKSVLITGSSGLIGSQTASTLMQRGFKVIGIDKEPPQDDPGQNFQFIECDMTKDKDVTEAVENAFTSDQQPTNVIHLAAYYDFSGKDSPLYEALTVEGTRRLLNSLRGRGIEQFIFSSTILLLEPVEPGEPPLNEKSSLQAEWEYPDSKVRAEKVLQEEQGDIPVVIHRIAGIYDDWCHSPPISQQIARIHQKDFESHFFPGRQDAGQPFVHLQDVVAALVATIENKERLSQYEIFLLGEPDLVPYGELQDKIGNALHGKDWTTIRVPKVAAKAGAWIKDKLTEDDEFIQPWMVDLADAHYPIDVSKVQSLLGWSPQFGLREQISVMAQKLIESPSQWYEENGLEVPDFIKSGQEKESQNLKTNEMSL